jgi:hypothetical protein
MILRSSDDVWWEPTQFYEKYGFWIIDLSENSAKKCHNSEQSSSEQKLIYLHHSMTRQLKLRKDLKKFIGCLVRTNTVLGKIIATKKQSEEQKDFFG